MFTQRLLAGAFVLAALVPFAPAAQAAPHATRFVVGAGSEVAYRVRVKTLAVLDEQIEGRNEAVRGEVRWPAGGAPTGWAEADVAGFHSGIPSRDHHVAKMLGAPALPRIRFQLARLEGFHADRETGSVVAVGRLEVNGHGREVHVPLRYTLANGTLRVEGDAPLRFADFGIDPPVLGLVLKRAPEVLAIHVRLVASEARTASR